MLPSFTSRVLAGIPGITHGFGTRSHPFPAEVSGAWDGLKPKWKQVHGVASCEVLGQGQECGEVDALWSRAKGQPIAVVTADCVPVLMARKDGGAVAAIHAGWRGTHARILRALWTRLEAAGERPRDWAAAIGPAIGPCCYEVSPELAQDFERAFATHGDRLAVPRHRHLDLPAVNAAELRAIGLGDVETLSFCTRCHGGDAPTFHSYRREGGGTRQFSAISRA